MTTSDALLVLGATARLTRLITSDDLGQWWVKDPIDAWMHGHPAAAPLGYEDWVAAGKPGQPSVPKRMRYHRYLAGLECPHCVGFWVGAAVMASYAATGRSRRARAAWRFVAGTLALNAVTVTLGTKLDYWS